MSSALASASYDQRFIDYRAVDWSQVRRTRSQFYQHFHYAYPGPIKALKQRLMVIPADQHGTQRLCSHTVSVDPFPDLTRQKTDLFGNRIFELELSEADRSVSFEVLMTVESKADQVSEVVPSPEKIAHLLNSTPLTRPNAEIERVAKMLKSETPDAHDLAQHINDWVHATMRYESGVTDVTTTAAQALAIGRGLCQDYSHLMLSLCRVAGLPAQYVSGHLLGEGGSHAWVEVFLPVDGGLCPVAFDPTNNRRPHLGYITVAVGRDYRDVSPTSGSFVAPYAGELTCSKRAGLILVEYISGDIMLSEVLQ